MNEATQLHSTMRQEGPRIDVAKAFGKGAGFGVGLALLSFIFFPILGLGDAECQGSPHAL